MVKDFNDGWSQEDIETAIAKLTASERKRHAENAIKEMKKKGGYFALGENGKQTWVEKKSPDVQGSDENG